MPETRQRINERRRANYAKHGATPKHKARLREWRMVKFYGITVEHYNLLLNQQKGRCAICREVPVKERLHVDHDHETGKVRGLLCCNCNLMIGNAKDNTLVLANAISYLENSKCP